MWYDCIWAIMELLIFLIYDSGGVGCMREWLHSKEMQTEVFWAEMYLQIL